MDALGHPTHDWDPASASKPLVQSEYRAVTTVMAPGLEAWRGSCAALDHTDAQPCSLILFPHQISVSQTSLSPSRFFRFVTFPPISSSPHPFPAPTLGTFLIPFPLLPPLSAPNFPRNLWSLRLPNSCFLLLLRDASGSLPTLVPSFTLPCPLHTTFPTPVLARAASPCVWLVDHACHGA